MSSVDEAVRLHNAVVLLGSFPALAEASLVVKKGEIVLISGANGAGKTTLLRLCAGLVPLARGEASVLGFNLSTQRKEAQAHVGILGHANGLYLDLTAQENLQFWGAIVGASTREIALSGERMGLHTRLLGTTVAKMSAGQRRRTALAILIIRRASLWLLDEPHAGLDAAGRDEIDNILREATSAGATVIVASHELERAGALATRRIEVVGGAIVERGAQ
ncbi:MAG: heme ABC exporter ATP-binding protein CcmA [bacterium]